MLYNVNFLQNNSVILCLSSHVNSMINFFKNHPFAKTGLISLPLIVFVIVMGFLFPKYESNGFGSFIIAFEFAKTPFDINALLEPLSRDEVRKVNIGNYIDYGFMITYTVFLITSFWRCSEQLNKKFIKTGIYIAMIVLIADFIENIFLLKLTDNYVNISSQSDMISNLYYLKIFTWIKWFSLSILFTVFYSIFYNEKWHIGIPAVVFLFPLLYLIASPSRTPEMLTTFTNSILLCFACLVLFLFITPKKWIEKNR